MAANPRPWSAAQTAWPCGSRTVDLGVTNTRAFMGTRARSRRTCPDGLRRWRRTRGRGAPRRPPGLAGRGRWTWELRIRVLSWELDLDLEELALTDFGDGGEPEAVERRADRLALRVEDGGLGSYEYACFHGNSDYRMVRGLPSREGVRGQARMLHSDMRVLLVLVGAGALLAQQPILYYRGTVNAASLAPFGLPNAPIAQGSIFTIFGENLGPARSEERRVGK